MSRPVSCITPVSSTMRLPAASRDALACCQQGVEFVLTDGDYPEEGTPITVVGRYETYTTPYYDYFHLVDGVRE